MKIGILSDRLHTSLAAALRTLLPGAEIISHDFGPALRNPALHPAILRDLIACDHVVTQDVPRAGGPLATFALRDAVPHCHLLPPLHFAGYHPDVIGLALDGTPLAGATGLLHSRIAVLAYLTGHTPAEAASLFNALVFARLGYFAAFAHERAALLARFRAYRIDLAPIFDSWAAAGCFMHAPQTPRMPVMRDLARLICAMAGVTPDADALAAADAGQPDPLAREPSHPFFPEIAARLGLPPSGDFCPPQPEPGPRVAFPPEVFLRGSYDAFRRLPRAALLAAPGVAAGLAALGLPESGTPRAPAAPPDAQAAFLTWQGSLLQIDAGSSMVVQRPLRPETSDATDLLAPHRLELGATPRPLAMLGGVMVTAGNRPGTACIRRGGIYLSAAPGRLAVRFDAERAGDWESFLPLSRPELEDLRSLLRGGWLLPDGERVPRAAVHLADGMRLLLGPRQVTLWESLPRRLSGPDEPLRIAIGDDLILSADPEDPTADVGLDTPPETALPPEVGSPEAFRAADAARLDLPRLTDTVFPPVTLTNADRNWALADRGSAGPLRIGHLHTRLTLWRARDKTVLLARGLEGILADGDGVWKDHGFLLAPRRLANGTAATLLRSPPTEIIEDPVCIFYNPNLQNYYHWLVEAMISLHVLAPLLPEGARLLMPPTLAGFRAAGAGGFDHRGVLNALGFGNIPIIEATAPAVLARDATWLRIHSLTEMPAAVLRSFRDRALALHKPQAERTGRIYVKRRHNRRVTNKDVVEALLTQKGFSAVYLEDLTAAEQIMLFAGAQIIVAMHGAGLANLLFCQPGTQVLEISPHTEFRPFFWLIAEKLGLPYAVLPCPSDGTFSGDMLVDVLRLRTLLRLLKLAAGDGSADRLAPHLAGKQKRMGPRKRAAERKRA
jgi:hypothetical protein